MIEVEMTLEKKEKIFSTIQHVEKIDKVRASEFIKASNSDMVGTDVIIFYIFSHFTRVVSKKRVEQVLGEERTKEIITQLKISQS